MRLYKITVAHWPTDDGKPWPRFVHSVLPADAEPWQTPVPPWMLPLVYEDFSGMEEFARYDGDDSGWGPPLELRGWLMPNPRNVGKTWFSAPAVYQWRDAAEKWGLRCRVVASDPVTWSKR